MRSATWDLKWESKIHLSSRVIFHDVCMNILIYFLLPRMLGCLNVTKESIFGFSTLFLVQYSYKRRGTSDISEEETEARLVSIAHQTGRTICRYTTRCIIMNGFIDSYRTRVRRWFSLGARTWSKGIKQILNNLKFPYSKWIAIDARVWWVLAKERHSTTRRTNNPTTVHVTHPTATTASFFCCYLSFQMAMVRGFPVERFNKF